MEAKTSEIMSVKLITARMTDSLDSAYAKMKENRIRHLPVMDRGEIIGIISDRDFQRGMHNSPHFSGPIDFGIGGIVRDFMNTHVISVPCDTELIFVIQKMINEKVSAVMITSGDMVVGIVSHEDLLRVLADLLCPVQQRVIAQVQNWLSKTPIGHVAHTFSLNGI